MQRFFSNTLNIGILHGAVQLAARYPYAEVRDNTICATMMPMDLLRASCHSLVRVTLILGLIDGFGINMFKGAPFPYELSNAYCDDWAYPLLTEL